MMEEPIDHPRLEFRPFKSEVIKHRLQCNSYGNAFYSPVHETVVNNQYCVGFDGNQMDDKECESLTVENYNNWLIKVCKTED